MNCLIQKDHTLVYLDRDLRAQPYSDTESEEDPKSVSRETTKASLLLLLLRDLTTLLAQTQILRKAQKSLTATTANKL